MAEAPIPRVKLRLIIRTVNSISRTSLVSTVCCIAGVLALLMLPVLAKSTYISENAIIPGFAMSMLSRKNAVEADRLIKDLSSLELKPLGASMLVEGVTRQLITSSRSFINPSFCIF